jgi:hypothetical protein
MTALLVNLSYHEVAIISTKPINRSNISIRILLWNCLVLCDIPRHCWRCLPWEYGSVPTSYLTVHPQQINLTCAAFIKIATFIIMICIFVRCKIKLLHLVTKEVHFSELKTVSRVVSETQPMTGRKRVSLPVILVKHERLTHIIIIILLQSTAGHRPLQCLAISLDLRLLASSSCLTHITHTHLHTTHTHHTQTHQTHQNPLSSFKDLRIHRDRGQRESSLFYTYY